jgi:hypothetical protein
MLGVVLIVGVAVAFYSTLGLTARQNTLKNDFLGFYAAGLQLRAGDGARIHDHTVQLEYQRRVQPTTADVVPFPRPHLYAKVFQPLAKHPQPEALTIWQILQIVGLLATWLLILRRFRLEGLQLASFYFPLPIGIVHGQDTGWMTFLAATSLYLFQAGQLWRAGLVLSLCFFKWHLIALLPFAMILGRQWRLLQGFCAGASILMAADLYLDGLAGWRAYLNLLSRRDLDRMTPGLGFMPNLQGLFYNIGLPGYEWPILLLTLAACALCAYRLPWPQAMLAAQLSALLLIPHTFQYDLAYLLFPILSLLAGGAQGALKWTCFLLIIPLPYLTTLFGPPWAATVSIIELTLLAALARKALPNRSRIPS